jgi:hypothetical protein
MGIAVEKSRHIKDGWDLAERGPRSCEEVVTLCSSSSVP